MALLKFKRSAVPGKVPTLADLSLGELAINTYDGKVYIRKDSGTASIVEVGGGSGVLSFNSRTGAVTLTSGDVTGALGYTPANRAGDTFTGPVTINSGASAQALSLNATADTFLNFRINSADSAYVQSSAGGMYVWNRQNTPMFVGTNNATRLTIGSGGEVTASVDLRAPIFYDSNNTAFYTDPASTSVMNTVNLSRINMANSNSVYADGDANAGWRFGGTGYVYFNQASPSYFETSVIARSGVRNDSAALLTLQGGTSGGTQINTDTRSPIYYDLNNTAFYLDPANSGTSLLTAGGVQFYSQDGFRFTSASAISAMRFGSSFTGESTAEWAYNRATAVTTLSVGNTGSALSTRLSIGSGGSVTANVDFRAPIYYDSDNTAYYADIASTSEFNTIQTRGGSGFRSFATPAASIVSQLYFANAGNTQAWNWQLDEGNNGALWNYNGSSWVKRAAFRADGLVIGPNGSGEFTRLGGGAGDTSIATLAASNGNLHIDSKAGFDLYLNWYTARAVWTEASVYAPIYYDRQDSSFYCDPNGISVLNTVNTWGEIGPRRNDTQSLLRSYNTSAGQPLQFYLDHNFGNVNIGNSRGAVFAGGSYWEIANSVRSPIFYDSNNTGYYLDPASHTRISTIGIETQRVYLGSINNDYDTGYYHFDHTQNTPTSGYGHAHIIRLNGDWNVQQFWGTGTDWDFWFRKRLNGSNSAWQFVMASTLGRWNKTSEGQDRFFFAQSGRTFIKSGNGFEFRSAADANIFDISNGGNATAITDMRAPIYYDSNNTARYLDPTGSSFVQGNFYVTRDGNSNDTFGGLEVRENSFQGAGTGAATEAPGINFHWSMRAAARIYMDVGGSFVLGGQNDITNNRRSLFLNELFAANSVRGTIFYDSNDTAYYVDPAGGTSASFAATVQFANTTQAKLNLFSTNYAIGIQNSTQYFRTGSRFSWFRNGVHSNGENDPGAGGAVVMTLDGSSNLTVTGNVTAYSDARLKRDVETIDGALDLVSKMRGVRYTRIDTENRNVGVIAQEMLEVLPEVVQQGVGDDDTLSVAYGNLVGVLIEAIKELRAEVEELKATTSTITFEG